MPKIRSNQKLLKLCAKTSLILIYFDHVHTSLSYLYNYIQLYFKHISIIIIIIDLFRTQRSNGTI